MFRTSKPFIAVAAAAVGAVIVGLATLLPGAEAQSSGKAPVILVLDQARVIGMSKAGQSIASQMQTLQQKANTELTSTVEELVSEAKELESKKDSMQEAQFTEEAKKVIAKRQDVPMIREIKVRELRVAEQKALSEVTAAMGPIVQEIFDSRGATLLLERQNVLMASQATDITDEVLQRLDAKLSTVKVEEVDLRKAIAEAQAAAAANNQ